MGCSLRLLIVSQWGILASESGRYDHGSPEEASWLDGQEEEGMGYAFNTYGLIVCKADIQLLLCYLAVG